MVLQDTWLKSGTVRENIAMGKPEATEDEIIAAAKAAHSHKFIMQLPNGYDTVLAEDGGNLSAYAYFGRGYFFNRYPHRTAHTACFYKAYERQNKLYRGAQAFNHKGSGPYFSNE